jgi:hypothetical protein
MALSLSLSSLSLSLFISFSFYLPLYLSPSHSQPLFFSCWLSPSLPLFPSSLSLYPILSTPPLFLSLSPSHTLTHTLSTSLLPPSLSLSYIYHIFPTSLSTPPLGLPLPPSHTLKHSLHPHSSHTISPLLLSPTSTPLLLTFYPPPSLSPTLDPFLSLLPFALSPLPLTLSLPPFLVSLSLPLTLSNNPSLPPLSLYLLHQTLPLLLTISPSSLSPTLPHRYIFLYLPPSLSPPPLYVSLSLTIKHSLVFLSPPLTLSFFLSLHSPSLDSSL